MTSSPVSTPLAEERFGVTAPISVSLPSAVSQESSQLFVSWLNLYAPDETAEGYSRRFRVLVELEELAQSYVRSLTPSKASGGSAKPLTARVLPFGSLRLGVISGESDIDTVVLLPLQISRDKFFQEFPRHLSQNENVSECNAVADARVPVIKVKFRDYYVDILASRVPDKYLDVSVSSGLGLLDESVIYQLETADMKSINGVRVADKILSLVPDCAVFRTATRFVKHFASQRCVYSNAIGYVGGVSWALMVGRVCQLYPNANALEIVLRFFEIYTTKWEWDRNAVVQLGPVVDASLAHLPRERHAQYREWNNHKYPGDATNPFPVITPIFPCHNTAYNVTESQKWCMLMEIGRAWRLLKPVADAIFQDDRSGTAAPQLLRRTLEEVCEEFPFFRAFRKFLVLEVAGNTEIVFTKLKGLVESRMRSLVKTLEDFRVYSRPHQGFFQDAAGGFNGCFYLGIWTDADEQGSEKEVAVDLTEPIKIFYSETIAKSLVGLDWFDGSNVRIHVKALARDALVPPTAPQSKRMRAD